MNVLRQVIDQNVEQAQVPLQATDELPGRTRRPKSTMKVGELPGKGWSEA